MGTGETGTPTKAAKLSIAQDQQASYPEWAAEFQIPSNTRTRLYCRRAQSACGTCFLSGGQPPHDYFPPSVAAGPQPTPYMWGPQRSHAYGQFGLLSPGAASEGTMATLAGGEVDGSKLIDSAKDGSPIQRSKESVGNVGLQGSKVSDTGKGHSGSANSVFSQRYCRNGVLNRGQWMVLGSNCTLPAYSPQGGETFASRRGNVAGVQRGTIGQVGAASKMCSSSSLSTNLGIGVQDYWSGSTGGGQGGKRTSASTSPVIVPTTPSTSLTGPLGREGVSPELWLQVETVEWRFCLFDAVVGDRSGISAAFTAEPSHASTYVQIVFWKVQLYFIISLSLHKPQF